MKKNFISIIMLGICQLVIGQEFKEKSFLSFFNNPSEKVYGISTGLIQQRIQPDGFTSTTYGLRLEPFGKGFSILFVPEIGFPQDSLKFEKHFRYKPTEVVNGLAVSGGYISFADVNGISISGGVQALRKVNGVSFSGYDNYAYKSNGLHLSLNASVAYHSRGALISAMNSGVVDGIGLQMAGFNDFIDFKGLQIGLWNNIDGLANSFYGVQLGLFNSTRKLRGLQLGLWNKNEKRSLPFINWQFKG